MVATRAMKAAARAASPSHAEEKKDDDDNFIVDRPQDDHIHLHDTSLQSKETTPLAEGNDANAAKKKKSPLLLLLCASGITSCYLWYGTVQENIFHMDNEEKGGDNTENQSITLFLLATGTFSSCLLALVWTVVGPILLPGSASDSRSTAKPIVGRLNHPLIVLTSLTYLSAMAASNESLHYVSYPTCVLAKSSKLIPTMVVGWLMERWRSWKNGSREGQTHAGDNHTKTINAMEWIGALLITAGILLFQYIQLHKQSNGGSSQNHGDKEVKGDSPYGLGLLGLSLFMDGLLGACQSTLKRKSGKTDATSDGISAYKRRPPTAMETMLYINLYATMILLPASHYVGQFQHGLAMMFSNSSSKSMLLLQLNLSASLGQVFIFLTIHHFSPLTCTTITTTRKFFTILLSVYKFGHVLDAWQWVSVGLVFGGLYLEIAAKLFEHHDAADARSLGKKKVE